jgi:hypothetical protein
VLLTSRVTALTAMAEGEAGDDHEDEFRQERGGFHRTLIGTTIAGVESDN